MIIDFESNYADAVGAWDNAPEWERPTQHELQEQFNIEVLYHLSRIADALESIRTASWSK